MESNRIVVVGTSGCGKSTFARSLAAQLDSPCIELDALYWGPNWTPKPIEEFLQCVREETAGDRWVIEGNYAMARDVIWPRATTVIWLNYSFATIFSRVLRRTIRRMVMREQLWNGNRESFRMSFFSRESILLWVMRTYRERKKEFTELRASGKYPPLNWVEFKQPKEAEMFLTTFCNISH